jgi:hypothetical protein
LALEHKIKQFGGGRYVNPILKSIKGAITSGIKMETKTKMAEKVIFSQLEMALSDMAKS